MGAGFQSVVMHEFEPKVHLNDSEIERLAPIWASVLLGQILPKEMLQAPATVEAFKKSYKEMFPDGYMPNNSLVAVLTK